MSGYIRVRLGVQRSLSRDRRRPSERLQASTMEFAVNGRFVDYAMHRVRMLRHFGITPYIVFDGGPLPAKKGTEESRAK